MAAYVDRPSWYWRERYWCHLLADSLGELHQFAARIGKSPRAFQDKRLPHYDLTIEQRQLAIGFGAVEVGSREIVVVARRLRIERRARDLPTDARPAERVHGRG